MTVTLLLRNFPEDLRQQVKAAAALERKTMAQLVAEAMKAYLAKAPRRWVPK